jgi:probable HAF family extracellular repeat protein
MPVYTYTSLDDPLAPGPSTVADGINGSGQIVGAYSDSSFHRHGFLYSNGTYTTLDVPLASQGTFASGINDAGQIIGQYQDATGSHGFEECHIGGMPRYRGVLSEVHMLAGGDRTG